jgi:predicted DNA-binding protein
MSTTVKRTSLCLTRETKRQLDELCKEFGESSSRIMSRSIDLLHRSLKIDKVPYKDKYKGD